MSNYSKYFKDVSHLDKIDIYRVLDLFEVWDHALGHAVKKLLLSGVRTGNKSEYDDVREARDTLNRWLEMEDEDERDEPDPVLIEVYTKAGLPGYTFFKYSNGMETSLAVN